LTAYSGCQAALDFRPAPSAVERSRARLRQQSGPAERNRRRRRAPRFSPVFSRRLMTRLAQRGDFFQAAIHRQFQGKRV